MGKKLKQQSMIEQASAVPFRVRGDEVEVCLITSSSKGLWCLPKGIIDPGETVAEAALKEAEEEAGIFGEICGEPLGEYLYKKWGRTLRVVVLLMKVTKVADQWEESHLRERKWVTMDEAIEMLDTRRGLSDFVLEAAKQLDVGVTN